MEPLIIALSQPKFPLGQVVITANAQAQLTPLDIEQGLSRHAHGDWGDLCDDDRCCNNQALRHGGRLFSAYGKNRQTFWIITESDRSATTVLLPLDY